MARRLLKGNSMIPQAGQTIGSVVLRYKIADGGMASVWAAEHVTLGREVAVKFLTKDPAADPEAVQRFALEARTVARVVSPHIPQVFDHGVSADGTPYIVMELVAGTDLKSWVSQYGCLDLPQTVRLVEQISLALAAAHELGVVHRDVKPENIILTGSADAFHAKLIDFGIAKSTALSLSAPSLTQAGTMVGTPSYMSPEQLSSASDVDERSDVWSLGVVAYWAVTGKLPFEGETFAAVCMAITRAHFTPPTEMRAGLPQEIDGWFNKALHREPAERFQSTDLMTRMLKVAAAKPTDWTRSLPVVAPPSTLRPVVTDDALVATSRPSRSGFQDRIRRRRENVIYAASGAALGLLVLSGFAFIPARTADASSDTRTIAPVGFAVAALPTPSVTQIAMVPPPPSPVEPAPAAPVVTPPPASAHPVPPTFTSLETNPKIRVRSTAPAAATPRVTSKATPRVAAPTVAVSAVESAPSPPPMPSTNGADWRPTDELGEP